MPKIIHLVLGKANPNKMNGVNKVVSNLATNMSTNGFDCSVWGITPTPNKVDDLPNRNFETKLFQASNNKLKIDGSIEKSLKTLNKNTVFHLHGGFIPEFFHVHSLLRKYKIPYIVTPHGCYNKVSMQNSKLKKTAYFNLFEKSLLKHSKAVHFVGKSESEVIETTLPKVKKVVIPNGQSLKELEFNFTKIENCSGPIFSFCGRMDKKMKGLDLLLKGFQLYKNLLGGSGILWLIGDGYQIEELKEMATLLNIDKYVKFWGKRFGEEKNNILANSDVFFHPSRYEGLPTAILEAAGLKLPCVVSDATNMLEYIKENNAGYVLNENTSFEIAETMVYIEKDKKYNHLMQKGSNAYSMILEQFNWQNISEKLIHLYSE